jgi:RIP metalloprotease RseP
VRTEIAFSDKGEVIHLLVDRRGKQVPIAVVPKYSDRNGMPMIDVDVAYNPVMTSVLKGSPLAQAGGRAGDRVLAVDDRPVVSVRDIYGFAIQTLGTAPETADQVSVRIKVQRKDGGEETLVVPVETTDQPQIGILPYGGNIVRAIAEHAPAAAWLRVGDRILSINDSPIDDLHVYRDRPRLSAPVRTIELVRENTRMTVRPDRPITERELAGSLAGETDLSSNRASPREGMPAARAGLRTGDRVIRVGNTRTANWDEVREQIVAAGMNPVSLTVERNGAEVPLTIKPAKNPKYALLGYEAESAWHIHSETNIFASIGVGWQRTAMAMKSVALTIRSLVTRRVSARHIGGPITLARVTYGVLDVGWGRYLYILALISINLAILNILPIPVLDGGQIVLLCAEKLRGKPLPDRVVGYFQMVGLLLILSLLVLAFRNDIVSLLN